MRRSAPIRRIKCWWSPPPKKTTREIKAIIDEADHRQDGELATEVYALKWANPVALSTSIKPIAPHA